MTTLTTGNEAPVVFPTQKPDMLMAYQHNVDVGDDLMDHCGEFVGTALSDGKVVEITAPEHCLIWEDAGRWTLRGFTDMGTPYPFVEAARPRVVAKMLATAAVDEDSLAEITKCHDAESLPAELTNDKPDTNERH